MSTSRDNATDERQLLSSGQPKSLWRNRDYLLLWSGQALSDIGGAVSEVAFPLLVRAVTHSPAQAGFVAALRALAATLFSLLAGVLVDRWDRKRVMLVCDTGRALSLASIPVAYALGHLTIWQLYITAFLEGTLMIVFKLAKTAAIPQVVTRAQLTTAVAQEEFVEGTTALLGPSLSGVLYTLGAMFPFLTDAISYLISIVTMVLIRTPFPLVLGALEFGTGLVDPIEDVPYFSHRLKLIPDELKGRVMSACRLFPGTMRPLGLALTGILIQRIGIFPSIWLAWAWLLVITVIVTVIPQVRRERAH